jgi:hypothetical protein
VKDYSPRFPSNIPAGEEVYIFGNQKKICPKIKKPPPRAVFAVAKKKCAQDFCGTAAFFALAASFLRLM